MRVYPNIAAIANAVQCSGTRAAALSPLVLAAALFAATAHAEDGAPAAQPGRPAPAEMKPNASSAAMGEHAGHGGGGGEHAGHAMHLPNGVVSLDVVAQGGRLHLLTGKNDNGKATLWHQVSADDGKSWSKEVEVQGPPGAGATVTRGSDARIAIAGKTLVAMWMSHVEGAKHGGAGPMISARSTDGGKTWAPAGGPADWPKGPHAFFTLSSDGKTMHAAWLDSRDGPPPAPGAQGMRYAFSTDAGSSWSKNITLDNVTCACCWTTSKADSDGNLFVLYRDKQPSDMAIGVVDAKTHEWTRLATVGAFNWDFPGCPHIGGGLAIKASKGAPEIHAVIGTRKKGDAGVYHLKSADGGKSWSAPFRLGDDSATHADIALGKSGRLAAVWDMTDAETNDGSLAIYASQSGDDGASWSPARRISAPHMSATHPRVVATQAGFVAFWTEKNESGDLRLSVKPLDKATALGALP